MLFRKYLSRSHTDLNTTIFSSSSFTLWWKIFLRSHVCILFSIPTNANIHHKTRPYGTKIAYESVLEKNIALLEWKMEIQFTLQFSRCKFISWNTEEMYPVTGLLMPSLWYSAKTPRLSLHPWGEWCPSASRKQFLLSAYSNSPWWGLVRTLCVMQLSPTWGKFQSWSNWCDKLRACDILRGMRRE